MQNVKADHFVQQKGLSSKPGHPRKGRYEARHAADGFKSNTSRPLSRPLQVLGGLELVGEGVDHDAVGGCRRHRGLGRAATLHPIGVGTGRTGRPGGGRRTGVLYCGLTVADASGGTRWHGNSPAADATERATVARSGRPPNSATTRAAARAAPLAAPLAVAILRGLPQPFAAFLCWC